jgi:fumarate reductase subunit D
MATKRSLEPVLWLLFSAGGVVSALFVPILVLLLGIAFPLGWVAAPSYEHLSAIVHHPITRVALFGICLLSLVHAAHRFRFTLYDGLQIKHLNELINLFCYGGAIALSVWAGYLLWQLA